MVTVGMVSASGPTDGLTYSMRTYADALASLGAEVSWYQCLDQGSTGLPGLPFRSRNIPGIGIPFRSIDMGVNRLWGFRHRLGEPPEDVLFMADPTLVEIGRSHPRAIVKVNDLRPLGPFADQRTTTWMFSRVIPKLRDVYRLVTPSRAVLSELLNLGFPETMIRVIPDVSLLGLHPEHLEGSVARLQEGSPLRVLTVSTDRPYKNLRLVVRIAQRLATEGLGKEFEFTIVSRLAPRTRRYIDSLKLGNVRVLSGLPSLGMVYELSDVLLHPSLYEGFGRTAVESLGFCLPVLATSIPAIRETVAGTAILLPGDDEGAWVETLRALRDPITYASWARKSLLRAPEYAPDRQRAAVAWAILEA